MAMFQNYGAEPSAPPGPQPEDRPPRYSDINRRPQPTSYGAASQPTSYYDNYQQPAYQQPTTTYQQPAYQQPAYQQPAYQQPAYQQPAYQQANYQPAQPSSYTPAHQAPIAYAQPQTQVITNQPVRQTIFREPIPSSHVWLSLFTCLCCCFVCGLIALITGQQVDSAYHSGNDQYAKRKSKAALHWSIAGIVFGVLVHLAWIGGAIYLIIKWTTPSVY